MGTIKIYKKIKNILEDAGTHTYQAVNFIMVQAYWNIGRLIVEEEQEGKSRADYGKYLIIELSKKLTKDFGRGFDISNLKYMRKFHLVFQKGDALRHLSEKEIKKGNALHSQLSWTHYRLLMRIEKQDIREFYIKECIENSWSTRQLERQINSFLYERLLMSKDKKEVLANANKMTRPSEIDEFIKDPYILDFLNLKGNKKVLETDIENAIINKLQDFLLELGKGFAFAWRQKRITVNGEHFYIDLVFYNYILKCFLLIDLKVGKMTHQDIGQIDFYVRYFEKNIKLKGDNPTIGLILCSEKNEAIAHYSVLKNSKQLFASKYKLYLPSEEELIKEVENKLFEMKINRDDKKKN